MIDHAKQLRLDAKRIREQQTANVNNNSQTMKHKNIHFFTYATDNMRAARERILIEAECSGWFASTHAFAPADLPIQFQSELNEILSLKRGGGYWIWKYPLLEHMLASVPVGDYVLYADAGCWIHHPTGTQRLHEWIKLLEETPQYDFLVFQMSHDEDLWTNERIFQAFNISVNDTHIRQSGQLVGGIKLIRNGANAREMLAKVYDILQQDPFLISDKYNDETETMRQRKGITNRPFAENRHDQSITSILSKMYGSVVIPDETWPPEMNMTAPILAAREKLLDESELAKMRQWKEWDQCHGPHPLRPQTILPRHGKGHWLAKSFQKLWFNWKQ